MITETLPPGPAYLLRTLPYFLVPTTLIFLCLKLAVRRLDIAAPTSLLVVCAVLARTTLFFFLFARFYADFVDKRGAAARGAVLAPHVRQSAFAIMAAFARSMNGGYPGALARLFLSRCDAVAEWAREYGNVYQLRLLTENRIVTDEPDHIKAILVSQFDSFEKGSIFFEMMKSLLGEGVFTSDGDMWKFHRAMTRPFFTRERISDFDIYDRNCDNALLQAETRLSEGHPVEFQDLAARFALDSATEFLFGQNVNSLSAGIPYPQSHPPSLAQKASFDTHPSTVFVKAFTEGQKAAAQRLAVGNDWPLFEFWGDRVKPYRGVIDDFIEPLMRDAVKKRISWISRTKESEHELEGLVEQNLLDHLVKHTQDTRILKDELVNLLVAGRDTTMGVLTFALYMLSEHPDIEQRLRREIFDEVGAQGRPSHGHMREMKYMRAFLNEILRLYPPVPLNIRVTTEAVVWPSKGPGSKPIYVPANTSCMYSVFTMQRRTDLWGPDALTFDPDRFLDERLGKYLSANPGIFCPFNAGPRICLGQQFAYDEASFFLVRLLQRFEKFTLDKAENVPPPADWARSEGRKGGEKVWLAAYLTMSVKGGLWVRMQELKVADV
ncbi:cytochrome P450 [Crassisporium funariophilum]|nr:cytochrome P450 [Crassisporium funariophilum]